MKKLILCLPLIIATGYCSAQATLDHAFPVSYFAFNTVKFSAAGDKIFIEDTSHRTFYLYNSDYSLWKSINVPALTGYRIASIRLVSDHLFNLDNTIEFVTINSAYSSATRPNLRVIAYNEFGSIINDFDSSSNIDVMVVDGVFKIKSSTYGYAPIPKIYSLPGALPCGTCGGLGVGKEVNHVIPLSDPSPNPSSGITQINYSITDDATLILFDITGKMAKAIPLVQGSNQISINTISLSPGLYTYQIQSGQSTSEAKKLVVVR